VSQRCFGKDLRLDPQGTNGFETRGAVSPEERTPTRSLEGPNRGRGREMAYFTRKLLRDVAARRFDLNEGLKAPVRKLIVASVNMQQFDIFLSHNSIDRETVNEAYLALCALGYDVYLDRVHDTQLNPLQVTKDTAAKIRERILQSRSLVVATSAAIVSSRWVPWELGLADGSIGKVAALPILESTQGAFSGSEYFDVYPKVEIGREGRSLMITNGVSGKT